MRCVRPNLHCGEKNHMPLTRNRGTINFGVVLPGLRMICEGMVEVVWSERETRK